MLSVGLPTFFQRLFHLRRAGSSLESPRYLLKWLLISTAIGLVAGVGALIFFEAIRLSTDFFLGKLVGYLPPDPAGEACGWRVSRLPRWDLAADPGCHSTVLAGPGYPC